MEGIPYDDVTVIVRKMYKELDPLSTRILMNDEEMRLTVVKPDGNFISPVKRFMGFSFHRELSFEPLTNFDLISKYVCSENCKGPN